MVTSEGYPLGYEVFAGNRNDVTTLQEIVACMEIRIWALDRAWSAKPTSSGCANGARVT